MDAVKKAASGAVETIRNSPLFRRKFGTYQKASSKDNEEERPISPERDRTPFVQGIYFQVRGMEDVHILEIRSITEMGGCHAPLFGT